MKRPRILVPALLLAGLGVAWAGVAEHVALRGWRPLVHLAGEGDSAAATKQLHAGLDAFGVVLHGLDIDEETLEFVGGVRDSLDSFDLSGFHESLPEERAGWRQLRVAGRCQDAAYEVRQARGDAPSRVSPVGPLGDAVGDLGLELRARPVEDAQGDVNYQLQLQAGLGVGAVGWNALTDFLSESGRLAASGDTRGHRGGDQDRPSTKTRVRLLESHPGIRPEDIEVLGVLWEAFPRVGDVLLSISRADDVMVFDVKGNGSYQQLRMAAHLRPDLIEARYPELAEFVEDLGPLAHLQVVWTDARGRQLARASFETKTLRLSFGCFVRDGRLLPVDQGVVVTAPEPPRADGEPVRFGSRLEITSQLNGIQTRIHGLEVDWTYTTQDRGGDLVAHVTKVPKVTMSGRAFGILPTWAIDVLIPGNLDELTREFLETACKGNEGEGITFAVGGKQAVDKGPGTLSVSAGVELLDSTLISLAMSIASQKLLPSADVRGDIHSLLVALEEAFAADLARYERLVQVPQTR